MPNRLLACACLVALVACSNAEGGGTGGGGSGTGGGTTGSGGTGGGGDHGGIGCTRTDEWMRIALAGPNGEDYLCADQLTEPIRGVVTQSSSTSITVDACPPGTGCAPSLHTLTFTTTSLALAIPTGALVEVRGGNAMLARCLNSVIVTNLDTWEGQTSPVPGARVWVAASDGGLFKWIDGADTPFEVEEVRLDYCTTPPADSCSLGTPGDYAFVFHDKAAPANTVTAYMGDTVSWSVVGQSYVLHNARSFDSGVCDGEGEFDWWLMPAAP